MKKIIVVICIFLFLWVNLGIMSRAFIPFDPKVQQYVDQGDAKVPLGAVLDATNSASSQFRSMGYGVIVLDSLLIFLAARLFYLNNRQ